MSLTPGPNAIKILQHKFYTTLFFKQSDWLLKNLIQSKCVKINVKLTFKIFICLTPGQFDQIGQFSGLWATF